MSEQAYENCYGVINNHIIGKSTVDNRNLALVYDPDSVYYKGDHCIHGMKYWTCNTNNTTGAWDATKWTQTRVGSELTALDHVSSVGTSAAITSGTPFTCPSDGYLSIYIYNNKEMAVYINSVRFFDVKNNVGTGQIYGLFVRKGMVISCTYTAGTDGNLAFFPFI